MGEWRVCIGGDGGLAVAEWRNSEWGDGGFAVEGTEGLGSLGWGPVHTHIPVDVDLDPLRGLAVDAAVHRHTVPTDARKQVQVARVQVVEGAPEHGLAALGHLGDELVRLVLGAVPARRLPPFPLPCHGSHSSRHVQPTV